MVEGSYTNPNPKTAINATFVYLAICRRYNLGIGVMSTATSVTRLITPVTVNEVTWLPHEPPEIVESQLKARGRQIRQPARMVAMDQATITPMVIQHTYMTRATGKMRRYNSRMEILVQLKLNTHRNCSGTISCSSLVMGAIP